MVTISVYYDSLKDVPAEAKMQTSVLLDFMWFCVVMAIGGFEFDSIFTGVNACRIRNMGLVGNSLTAG